MGFLARAIKARSCAFNDGNNVLVKFCLGEGYAFVELDGTAISTGVLESLARGIAGAIEHVLDRGERNAGDVIADQFT